MSPWRRGSDVISRLLDQGDLDHVAPSDSHAARLLKAARTNLDSAILIRTNDPGGSIQLAYDAARKAATALLAIQGLRPTAAGGHVAVQNAVNAQFGKNFAEFGRMRRRRHEQEYPSPQSATATESDAGELIDFAERILFATLEIVASKKLTPWE